MALFTRTNCLPLSSIASPPRSRPPPSITRLYSNYVHNVIKRGYGSNPSTASSSLSTSTSASISTPSATVRVTKSADDALRRGIVTFLGDLSAREMFASENEEDLKVHGHCSYYGLQDASPPNPTDSRAMTTPPDIIDHAPLVTSTDGAVAVAPLAVSRPCSPLPKSMPNAASVPPIPPNPLASIPSTSNLSQTTRGSATKCNQTVAVIQGTEPGGKKGGWWYYEDRDGKPVDKLGNPVYVDEAGLPILNKDGKPFYVDFEGNPILS